MSESELQGEKDRIQASGFDALLNVCADAQRRIMLRSLAEEDRALTVRDLLYAIAEHKHHTPAVELSAEVVEEILISLRHCHLPNLAAAGLVEYDSERGLVGPTEKFGDVSPTISAILDVDPSLDPLGDE